MLDALNPICSSGSDLDVLDDLGFGVTMSPPKKLFINNASIYLFGIINIYGGDVRDDKF